MESINDKTTVYLVMKMTEYEYGHMLPLAAFWNESDAKDYILDYCKNTHCDLTVELWDGIEVDQFSIKEMEIN